MQRDRDEEKWREGEESEMKKNIRENENEKEGRKSRRRYRNEKAHFPRSIEQHLCYYVSTSGCQIFRIGSEKT
jgi:hypothetical protein